MDAIDTIRRLHEHRAWVNRKLIEAAKTLTADQLRRTFPIGQGTLWRTLTHLYAAEYVWLEALKGNEHPLVPGDVPDKLPGNQEGLEAMSSLEELISNWTSLEGRWQKYLQRLTPEPLEQVVYKVSTSSGYGKRHATRRLDVLLHVCTHAQYTTAQAVNILRHLGIESLPDPMLITLARQQTVG